MSEATGTLYLIDANVLIEASNLYYQFDQVPEYWVWLADQVAMGHVKMPWQILDEIKPGEKEDPLVEWLETERVRNSLRLDDDINPRLVQEVLASGYGGRFTEDQYEKMGRDPILIAYGLHRGDRHIVTAELSNPRKERHNQKIPNVCKKLNVSCKTPFEMNKELQFSTGWK